MELALIKEINKEYLEAIKCYEDEINGSSIASLESYINLAFLYWSFAFELFEFNIPNNISENWSKIGGERYSKILELGLKSYPSSVELIFWKKYFSHISFGEIFSEQDCKRLVEKHGDFENNIPYFFLYLFDNARYKKEREELINECNKTPTAKLLYIKSIIG
jgi:hypothetical protein